MTRRREGAEAVERTLRDGETRFVPKPRKVGRGRSGRVVWDVYDRARGSFPVHLPGVGHVLEAASSWEACRVECDRLAAQLVSP